MCHRFIPPPSLSRECDGLDSNGARLDAKSLRNISHQTGVALIIFNFVSVGNTQSSLASAESIWTSNTQTTPSESFATITGFRLPTEVEYKYSCSTRMFFLIKSSTRHRTTASCLLTCPSEVLSHPRMMCAVVSIILHPAQHIGIPSGRFPLLVLTAEDRDPDLSLQNSVSKLFLIWSGCSIQLHEGLAPAHIPNPSHRHYCLGFRASKPQHPPRRRTCEGIVRPKLISGCMHDCDSAATLAAG